MKFLNMEHMNEKFMDGWNHFAVLSPFIIKGNYGKNDYSFLTLDGEYKRIDGKWGVEEKENYNFQNIVKEYLINKLKKIDASLDLSDFKIKIDELDKDGVKHNKHKVKKVYVKNVLNYANQCQLSIYCKKNIAELLYNIGIGQSTGAGFGAIYKTENHHYYRSSKPKVENKTNTKQLSEVS
jgi:CRISPR-associated endoribonuclease Cas6